MKMPVLSGRLSEEILKESAEMGRRIKAGATGNLVETKVGLCQ